jgi:hypothetical protein
MKPKAAEENSKIIEAHFGKHQSRDNQAKYAEYTETIATATIPQITRR